MVNDGLTVVADQDEKVRALARLLGLLMMVASEHDCS